MIKTAEQALEENGYDPDEVKVLDNYSYDDALIGVTSDGRAVYDYNKMVEWLKEKEGWSDEQAVEWIDYNTVRALPYFGSDGPIVIYPFE